MRKFQVTAWVWYPEDVTEQDVQAAVEMRLNGLPMGSAEVTRVELIREYCYKTVNHPDGFGGTALCRLVPGHEGNCSWPWGNDKVGR